MARFLTADVRKATYGVLAAVGALLVVLGVTDQAAVDQWLVIAERAASVAALVVAALHVTPDREPGRHEATDVVE